MEVMRAWPELLLPLSAPKKSFRPHPAPPDGLCTFTKASERLNIDGRKCTSVNHETPGAHHWSGSQYTRVEAACAQAAAYAHSSCKSADTPLPEMHIITLRRTKASKMSC